MFEVKLKNPLEYGGKKIEKLVFDFDNLTGEDFIAAEAEVRTMRPMLIYPDGDAEFLAALAAKAAKVSSVVIKDLPMNEFLRIRGKTRNFINNSLGVATKV